MLGAIGSFLQPAQPPQPPFGCSGSCEGSVAASRVPTLNVALATLAGVIGTWGIIEQYKIQKRMIELAEGAADRADKFLAIAKSKYDNIDIPTYKSMEALYDRYKSEQPFETEFLNCAFALKGWAADFCLVEGRAVLGVQRVFDMSLQSKRRALGRYDTGRACHDLTYFSGQLAIAKTNAATKAYNDERKRKLDMDKWYWERWKDGANYLLSLGNRAVNAITGGTAGLAHGINDLGKAVSNSSDAASGQAGALANSAQFWGNVASGGLNGFGQAVGAGYFNSAPAQPTYTSMKDSAPVYSGYSGSIKD